MNVVPSKLPLQPYATWITCRSLGDFRGVPFSIMRAISWVSGALMAVRKCAVMEFIRSMKVIWNLVLSAEKWKFVFKISHFASEILSDFSKSNIDCRRVILRIRFIIGSIDKFTYPMHD